MVQRKTGCKVSKDVPSVAASREKILSIAKEEKTEELNEFIKNSKEKKEVNIDDLLNNFTEAQLEQLWGGLQKINLSTLAQLETQDEEKSEQIIERLFGTLNCIILLALSSVRRTTPHIPPSLHEAGVLLDVMLPSLPDESEVKTNCVKLLELWWNKQLEHREEVGFNTLCYLLQKTQKTSISGVDVKRIWKMQDLLKNVNFQCDSAKEVKSYLLQCFEQQNFFKVDEGRRFLAHVFTLDKKMVKEIHTRIKQRLPHIQKAVAELYGDVYFRAWQKADGNILEILELECIQDLMYCAIHIDRDASQLCSILRKLLWVFHKNKKQKNVDSMLFKLYQPILWRALKVNNGMVRWNAVILFTDSFPLQNPDACREESDALLQKQIGLLKDMLLDPVPHVRISAIEGACGIISLYWEFLPAETIMSLLKVLFMELLGDSSSLGVREMVVRGITTILDNHLTHLTLKPLLQQLKTRIHDHSEQVRVAVVDLLLKVKTIRTIKFWDVVPIDHIMYRLEVDEKSVGRRIQQLLMNSFLPKDAPDDVKLERCLHLVLTYPDSVRKFFTHAKEVLSVDESVSFIIMICRCILTSLKIERERESNSLDNSTEAEEEDDDLLSATNTSAMICLSEIMAILWAGMENQIYKDDYRDIRQDLYRKLGITLQEMMKFFVDERIMNSIIYLAGKIPPGAVPSIRRICVSKLKAIEEGTNPADYEVFLGAICQWGEIQEFLELITDWTQPFLTAAKETESESPGAQKKSKKSKSKKKVAFAEVEEPKPHLGLQYLSCLLKHPDYQQIILRNHKKALWELKKLFEQSVDCLKGRLCCDVQDDKTDAVLLEISTMYCKLVILTNEGVQQVTAVEVFKGLIDYAENMISSVYKTVEEPDSATKKRPADKDLNQKLSQSIIQAIFNLSKDLLLVGHGDRSFTEHLYEMCLMYLKKDEDLALIKECVGCLSAVIDYRFTHHGDEEEGEPNVQMDKIIVTSTISSVLVSLEIHNKENKCYQKFESIRDYMSELLLYVVKNMEKEVAKDVIAESMGVVAAELSHHSGKFLLDDVKETVTSLPNMSRFVCEMIFKRRQLLPLFLSELKCCIESGVLETVHQLHGAVHLLATFCKCKQTAPGLKECLNSVISQVKQFLQDKAESLEDDKETIGDLKTKLAICEETFPA